jgi:hypothetical protein
MEQNLVGYLLETLDSEGHHEVETYLRDHPEVNARLDLLRQGLAPLAADADSIDPPPGLALATLARIAEHKCRSLPPAPPPSPSQVGGPPRRWFRRADLLVAAVLMVVVGGLCAPWLVRQWDLAQRKACEQNLVTLWKALNTYHENNNGNFPKVQADGPHGGAGIFVPALGDARLLGPEVTVLCPAVGRRQPTRYTLSDLRDLYGSRREEFNLVARDLAGSYAYTLGYRLPNDIAGLRRDDGDLLPIVADRPGNGGLENSPNHSGEGQNVLFIGGSVRWCPTRYVGIDHDDIYLNKRGQVHAGVDRNDTVLASSDATPYPQD